MHYFGTHNFRTLHWVGVRVRGRSVLQVVRASPAVQYFGTHRSASIGAALQLYHVSYIISKGGSTTMISLIWSSMISMIWGSTTMLSYIIYHCMEEESALQCVKSVTRQWRSLRSLSRISAHQLSTPSRCLHPGHSAWRLHCLHA